MTGLSNPTTQHIRKSFVWKTAAEPHQCSFIITENTNYSKLRVTVKIQFLLCIHFRRLFSVYFPSWCRLAVGRCSLEHIWNALFLVVVFLNTTKPPHWARKPHIFDKNPWTKTSCTLNQRLHRTSESVRCKSPAKHELGFVYKEEDKVIVIGNIIKSQEYYEVKITRL